MLIRSYSNSLLCKFIAMLIQSAMVSLWVSPSLCCPVPSRVRWMCHSTYVACCR
uniref:Uncharacterized protein n=1 Tax=Picea glauca TaxID=3330 RepID=A0A101M2X5_PICGL|nr:hypothetical protein ABT39_MTgene3195 [Picea glauca]QHR88484.1 hypothetical protein Q903MT_gene2498 [Picea sitchensis]